MADRSVTTPLIVIVGPTASGKSALALNLAERHNGEVIAADSRTIYRGLDIGTAKPTPEERQRVRHFGIDLIEANQTYSAAEFQHYATKAIRDIRNRGKVPFLVGGTGLYVNGLIYNYEFTNLNKKLRQALQQKSVDALYKYCAEHNIQSPHQGMSKPHLINYIVRQGQPLERKKELADNTHIVGITTDKSALRTRIHDRAKGMIDSGVAQEALRAAEMHGWSAPGLSGNIYPVVKRLVEGGVSPEQAAQLVEARDWQLAKRQLTWFRRDPNVHWLSLMAAEHYIDRLLTSEH